MPQIGMAITPDPPVAGQQVVLTTYTQFCPVVLEIRIGSPPNEVVLNDACDCPNPTGLCQKTFTIPPGTTGQSFKSTFKAGVPPNDDSGGINRTIA